MTLERFLNNILAGVILVVMMALVTCDVLARYLFRSPIQGVMELTEFMMVGLAFFSLAHTQALRAHISVELVVSRFSSKARLICDLITYFLGLFIFAVITWQSGLAAVYAFKSNATTFGTILFPLFPAKFIVLAGSFILCLRFVMDIIECLGKLLRGVSR